MIKTYFINLIYAGHVDEPSAEVRKQILAISLFSLVSSAILFIFGISGLENGRNVLAAVVLSACAINAANYIYLRKTSAYGPSSYTMVLMMTTLCLYLLCSGGAENMGPLWFFILPTLIFYILGLHLGRIVIALLFCFVVFLLYYPDNPLLFTSYPDYFIHRFTGSLFSVCVLAYTYEFTRKDCQDELVAVTQKLEALSKTDELTGLANRREIIEKLEDEKNRFERNNHPFSILVIDIDLFKQVNDKHGHICGDFILQKTAETFVTYTQKRDCVARWGGEEFLILLPETTLSQAEKIAERLRAAVEAQHNNCEESTVQITISVGIAEYTPEQTISQFLNIADQLLYKAKATGRNRVITLLG